MRKRFLAVLLSAAATLTACSVQSGETEAAPATVTVTAPASAPPSSQEAAGFMLPDYVGKTLDIAASELLKNGILYDAKDAVNGKAVLSPKNWTVLSSNPGPGSVVKSGEKVTFQVHKPGEPKASEPPAEATTSTGLDETTAQAACDIYGDNEFPYGWDPHWILGKQPAQLVDDRWLLKVEADVTNQFNAEAKMTVECTVGGTKDRPDVESFLAY